MQFGINNKNYSPLKFLGHYLSPFKSQIIVILLSIAIVSSAILGLGYALKYLIDQGFKEHNLNNLNQAFILFIIIIGLLSIASYNRSFRVNWICEQLETNIKKDTYKNIINLSPSFFELNKVSNIVSRLTTDLSLVSNTIVMICSFSLRNIIMAIGGLILLCISSFKLTFYVLIILPIILLPLIIIGRKTRNLSKKNQQEISNCNSQLEESLNFIKTIQAYNQTNYEYNRFEKLLKDTQQIAYQRIKLRSILFALVIALILSSIAVVLWIGGHDVIAGRMSAGSLSSFIFYSILVATSIGGLSEVFSDWQRAIGALERIIEINKATSAIIEIDNPVILINSNDVDLNLENIHFTYPSQPNIKILEDININIQNGKTIALVGPSGAGKSTIFQLLLRFYDPDSGSIKINNTDIKNLSLKNLRENFALVSQDSVIFSGTAYENILYGKTDATKTQVEEAAKMAEIFDFFNSLPDGLNTYLGEKGVKLSGGQKQRIAIARAILRNPKVLLLDEATSALDSENERLVQQALSKFRENRSTLVIAHRISTIVNADQIIVLNKGKIVAEGTHSKLLKTNLLYQQLSQNYLANS